ncbi:protein RDM1-like [Senna tora]|uniref:Protein RDM1-like n=1 Tax=Senna tora TaxID=362788 RepID=A0A834TJL4_9FABA|nr:protein RDM1-like [Senna tora]
MLKRHRPLSYKHLLVQDSDTESDEDIMNHHPQRMRHGNPIIGLCKGKKKMKQKLSFDEDVQVSIPTTAMPPNFDSETVVELAREYQKHMKKITIVNWQGLAKTLKDLYGQPLHYLTHMLCKQWDKSRFGSEDAEKPLDTIFNVTKAEAIIWEVEAIHRLSTSHLHLANLWLHDPQFYDFVHDVLPFS